MINPQENVENEAEALMHRVGNRVRAVREMKGIPRRVVSEKSGVSLRYLAQLEAGEGNISIGLLHKLAASLGHRIEWFLSEEDPWNSELFNFVDLFRAAPEEKRNQVKVILHAASSNEKRAKRICLIGLRGAGKSTLGKMAAHKLGVPFQELNREIEEVFGMPVNEVLALYGQEGYRHLELQSLKRIMATHDTVILAVAGGVVADPENFNLLLSNFHTIWLQARPEEHMTRVIAQGDMRPMSGNPEAMDQLRRMLENRRPLYERADFVLDTSGKSMDESLEDLTRLIQKMGIFEE